MRRISVSVPDEVFVALSRNMAYGDKQAILGKFLEKLAAAMPLQPKHIAKLKSGHYEIHLGSTVMFDNTINMH